MLDSQVIGSKQDASGVTCSPTMTACSGGVRSESPLPRQSQTRCRGSHSRGGSRALLDPAPSLGRRLLASDQVEARHRGPDGAASPSCTSIWARSPRSKPIARRAAERAPAPTWRCARRQRSSWPSNPQRSEAGSQHFGPEPGDISWSGARTVWPEGCDVTQLFAAMPSSELL